MIPRLVSARAALAFLWLTAGNCLAGTSSCTAFQFGDEIGVGGWIVKRTYAGPPNFQSVQRGDMPETIYVLQLNKPACVHPAQTDQENEAAETVGEAQLVVMESGQSKTASRLMGRRVWVTGKFFSAHSGHHHTPVLLEVTNVRRGGSTHPSSEPSLRGAR